MNEVSVNGCRRGPWARKYRRVSSTFAVMAVAASLVFSACARSTGVPTASSSVEPAPTTTSTTAIVTTPTATTQRPSPTPVASPSRTGPYGDLRIGMASFGGESFDSMSSTESNVISIMVPLSDYLVGLDGGAVGPRIAEKWTIAADGLSWTFNIRKGVKFHDGSDLTARDVKFSLDRYGSKGAMYAYVRDLVDHTDIIDDYTVRVFTKGTQPSLLTYVGGEAAAAYALIMPKDYFEKNGLGYFQAHPVGSGPFKFVNHAAGDSVQYEAVNQHWLQTPAFKNLTVIQIPEESTRVAALKTGSIDATDVGMDAGRNLEAAGFRTATLSTQSMEIRLYHTYDPLAAKLPTGDIRVRQALSLAINRDDIIKNFFYGKAGPAFAPDLTHSSREIDVPYWQDYFKTLYRYDSAAAKKLLADAGYAGGFSITFYQFDQSGTPYMPALAQVIQGYWQAIGVKTNLTPVDWGVFSGMRWVGQGAARKPNPTVVGQASLARQAERADTTKNMANSVPSTGTYAAFGNTRPDLDRLMKVAQQDMDPATRRDALAKIVTALSESFATFGIATAPSLAAIGPNIDITFPPMAQAISTFAYLAQHRK